jgi:hypothetical protein
MTRNVSPVRRSATLAIFKAAAAARSYIGSNISEPKGPGALEVDLRLKVPPTVDQLLSLLRCQRADEMPAHEVKDCVTGLLAAEGVDRAAVPAVQSVQSVDASANLTL